MRSLRPRQLFTFAPHTGSQTAVATASTLMVRYPFAIDTPPTITNNLTPLVGQYENYLSLLIEVIESEVGALADPITGLIGGKTTLMDFLGTEAAPRISQAVGNSAGQIFGFEKTSAVGAGSAFGSASAVATGSHTTLSGQNTALARPLMFSCTQMTNPNYRWIDNNGVFAVRGEASWGASSSITYKYRGCDGTTAGTPVGTATHRVHLLFLYAVDS